MALLADQYTLSQDSNFQHRVQEAIVSAAIAIQNEASNVAFHPQRVLLAAKVLTNPGGYASVLATGIATDANVGTDAGSPPNSSLVTDAHITSAVSSQWNAYATTSA
jgi:hypothetical protein